MKDLDVGPPYSEQVNVKMTPELRDGLNRIYRENKITPSDLLRSLAVEAVRFFDREKYFHFPLNIAPQFPDRAATLPHQKQVQAPIKKNETDDRKSRAEARKRASSEI